MAKIAGSLVADLALFVGLSTADLDAILSEARSVRTARCFSRVKKHTRDRRDLRGPQGDRPVPLPSDRDRRRRQHRAGVVV